MSILEESVLLPICNLVRSVSLFRLCTSGANSFIGLDMGYVAWLSLDLSCSKVYNATIGTMPHKCNAALTQVNQLQIL